MRYLVVLPPTGPSDSASFHDLEGGELAVGDQLLIDALQVRVRNVVHVPAHDGYDATLICTACD